MSCDHGRVFALIVAAFDAAPGAKLRQIAANLRVHRHTVAAIIQQQTGLRPRVWRRREIACRAKSVLIDWPTLSVKEVAAKFDLTSNGLRRLLLRECGLTPTALRANTTGSARFVARRTGHMVVVSAEWLSRSAGIPRASERQSRREGERLVSRLLTRSKIVRNVSFVILVGVLVPTAILCADDPCYVPAGTNMLYWVNPCGNTCAQQSTACYTYCNKPPVSFYCSPAQGTPTAGGCVCNWGA
jgi:AraC-like DNA-binding protein